MAEELNMTLPDRGRKPDGSSKLLPTLILLVLLVGVANLIVTAVFRNDSGRTESTVDSAMPPSARQNLALKLEKQGLRKSAIEEWKEYLASSQAGTEERAKVWYRIGKIYQEGDSYERALDAYYRSESFAKLQDLEQEINRRVQECLEGAGKFSALRYELAGRVGMGDEKEKAGWEILAEIGKHKISKEELDQRIEEQIERQMETFGASLPEDARKRQKEELVKRFASGPERLRFLNQIILEEILYRKAREDKLMEDKNVRALLQDAERAILAQQVLEKEFADQIKITASDLQNYYEAHKKDYVEPEQAKISHILLKDEKAATDLIDKLKENGNFEELAKEYSLDKDTKENGGAIKTWIHKGGNIPVIGSSEEAAQVIFGTEAGKVAEKPVKSDKGFHIIKVRERKPERQKAFDEVRDEVYRALRTQKEKDVQEALMAKLKERYDVVIHSSSLQTKPEDEAKTAPKGDARK